VVCTEGSNRHDQHLSRVLLLWLRGKRINPGIPTILGQYALCCPFAGALAMLGDAGYEAYALLAVQHTVFADHN
jgi:hypothetical protein